MSTSSTMEERILAAVEKVPLQLKEMLRNNFTLNGLPITMQPDEMRAIMATAFTEFR